MIFGRGSLSARGQAGGPGRELPVPVAPDSDRGDVVPRRVERGGDGARRGEADLVLARAAAGEDGHTKLPGHEVGVVVVVWFVDPLNRPTKRVTTAAGFAWVPPAGSWEMTTPSIV